MVLQDIIYVPDISVNLLSARKMAQKGLKTTFDERVSIIKYNYRRDELIVLRELTRNRYIIRVYKVNKKPYKDSNYTVFYTTFENPIA